jgi:hypothetical protein
MSSFFLKTSIFLIITVSLFANPTPSLAQSAQCGVKDNKGSNFDLPNTKTDPLVTPSPFNPDLGYSDIKECLPVSKFDNASWEQIIAQILETLNYIIAFLAIFGLIVSGIMYITAGGDTDKAEKARHNIVWIVIGILIYMFTLFFVPLIRAGLISVFNGGG